MKLSRQLILWLALAIVLVSLPTGQGLRAQTPTRSAARTGCCAGVSLPQTPQIAVAGLPMTAQRRLAELSGVYQPSLREALSADGWALPVQQTSMGLSCPELAFFCRVEVKLEKAARVPVKFRLGDVRYVDYLEGKRDDY